MFSYSSIKKGYTMKKLFVEVGAYLPEKVFGKDASIHFIKNTNETNYILGGYRNGTGPLEVGISIIMEKPKNENDLHFKKKELQKNYPCEKEILAATILDYENLSMPLDDFLSTIAPDDGFSLMYEDGKWVKLVLDDFEMLPMYDHRYFKTPVEELRHEHIELLTKFDEYDFENEEYDIFIADDSKAGFILKGNKVLDIFSLEKGRESELLVALKMATPFTGKEFLDISPIIQDVSMKVLIQQQVMTDYKDRSLMYSTLIGEDKIITDSLKPLSIENKTTINDLKFG